MWERRGAPGRPGSGPFFPFWPGSGSVCLGRKKGPDPFDVPPPLLRSPLLHAPRERPGKLRPGSRPGRAPRLRLLAHRGPSEPPGGNPDGSLTDAALRGRVVPWERRRPRRHPARRRPLICLDAEVESLQPSIGPLGAPAARRHPARRRPLICLKLEARPGGPAGDGTGIIPARAR